MKINGRNLEHLNVIVNSFTYGSCEVESNIYNIGMNHLLLSQNITSQIRELIMTFESELDISKISAMMLSTFTIDTEDGYLYDCILSATPTVEHIGCDYYKVTYTLSCIKKGHKQKISITYPHKTVSVKGNHPAYPVITIAPQKDIASLSIMGTTVRNLKKGKTVVIDSMNKLIEENGINKFKDADLFKWPVLIPGRNVLSITSSDVAVSIEYYPIYM